MKAFFSYFPLAMCMASTCFAAHPVDNLQPGEWYEVPNSKMRAVAPNVTSADNIVGNFGPDGVVRLWSGGAFDTKRDNLIVWGGGHAGYGGNEIYTFDVNNMAWTRVTDPSDTIIKDGNKGQLNTAAGQTIYNVNGDGTPLARHTYDGIEYLPNVDRFWAQAGSVWYHGAPEGLTWTFDFIAKKWTRKTDAITESSGYSNVSAYDPISGHVFQYGYANLVEYDPVNDKWTHITKAGSIPLGMTGAIDPIRRKFVMIGRGESLVFDISVSGKSTKQTLSTTGATEIINCDAPGFVYDPVSDKFVAWCGGGDVYTLNMDTLTWFKMLNIGTATPDNPYSEADYHGTFGRFQYVPSLNAFVVVTNMDKNVFFYKLTSGKTAQLPAVPGKPEIVVK